MDRSLIKKGGHKAAHIKEEALLEKILALLDEDASEYEPGSLLEEVPFNHLMSNPQIYKDVSKIIFDAENYIADPKEWEDKSLIGFHTLESGLTFLKMAVGGDWEMLLFIIIDWSGRSLRGYVPSYGNCFNPDFKTAFGSEGESEKISEPPYNECEDFDVSLMYLRK